MVEISLRQEEARLVYLAVAYHLGRPGSELDPLTKQPVEHGLAEVAQALQPQLRLAVAIVSLDDNQTNRLLSGMLGSISELKTYPMLEPRPDGEGGGRRSSVRGFDATLRHLFPEVEAEPETSIDLAEQMLMLKRLLDQRLATLPRGQYPGPAPAAELPARKKGWWPLGR